MTQTMKSKVTGDLPSGLEKMENLFFAIDQLKTDLEKTTKFELINTYSFNCHQRHDIIAYTWDEEKSELLRQTPKEKYTAQLKDVSSFYITYFEGSQSVLYRIEMNNKEQIRGYVWLKNLTKEIK